MTCANMGYVFVLSRGVDKDIVEVYNDKDI